ncbi:MAG: hypothetical protein SGILL_005169 [Bacillariaceae sp.]
MTSIHASIGRAFSSSVFRQATIASVGFSSAAKASFARTSATLVLNPSHFPSKSVRVEKAQQTGKRSFHNTHTTDFDSHFRSFGEAHSRTPIPYTSSLEGNSQLNYDPDLPRSGTHKKVSIVGCGQVGMATAYAVLNQGLAGTISLIDMNRSKLEGEAKDLEQGSAFFQHTRILASDEYSVSKDSHLVIVTAGAAQKPGESRLSLVERNVSIMQSVIPKVLAYSPNAAICIVANPCDILTAVASKIAGPTLPAGRIFGSGTCLDSSRLRSLIAKSLNLDTSAVQGYILGEHGDSSVPIWSSVRIGGLPFLELDEQPGEALMAMHSEVVNSAYDVIERKGSTNWAIGLTSSWIGKAILHDTRNIMPLSTCVRGMYGIEDDVFLSVPCVLGAFGVHRTLEINLAPSEREEFVKTAGTIWDIQKDIWRNI